MVVATVTGDADLSLPPAAYDVEDLRGSVRLVGLESTPGAANTIQVTTVDGMARLQAVHSVATLR